MLVYFDARLAQLVERSIYTRVVAGSSPAPRTRLVHANCFACANTWAGRSHVSSADETGEAGSWNFASDDEQNIYDHKQQIMTELQCIVRGLVQGVWFRDFTKRSADSLRLQGVVQNMSDGTVHVRAQGTEEELHEFLRRLSKGPAHARVEIISVKWQKPEQTFEGFTIAYE